MQTTKVLGLKKPEENDFYNVDVQNENSDALDALFEKDGNGSVVAKNALALDGHEAEYFAPLDRFKGATINTSIKEKALELGMGCYFYYLGGSGYNVGDIPNGWNYASVLITKRNASSIEITLFDETSGRIACTGYNGQEWTNWKEFASTDELRTELSKYVPLTGGNLTAGAHIGIPFWTNGGCANGLKILNSDGTQGGLIGAMGWDGNPQYLALSLNGEQSYSDEGGLAIYKDNIRWKRNDVLHTGNMVDHVLPKTGATHIGEFTVTSNSKNGRSSILKNSSNEADFGTLFVDCSADGKLARIEISALNNTAKFIDNESKECSLIHTGNMGSYVLPLDGGGTVKTSGNNTITNESTSVDMVLNRFVGASGALGYLGFNGVQNPVYVDNSGNSKTLLHTGNMADYVLPKSGGELANTLEELLSIKNTAGNVALIGYRGTSGVLGFLGFNNIDSPVIYSPTLGTQALLHTGNIGDYVAVDNETGTFTLKLAGVTLGTGTYYKVGKMVHCRATGKFPQDFDGGYINLTGFPFANASLNGSVADFHTNQYYGKDSDNTVFNVTASEITINLPSKVTAGQPFSLSAIYFTE